MKGKTYLTVILFLGWISASIAQNPAPATDDGHVINTMTFVVKAPMQRAAPLFTPATKAAPGQHDQNISFDEIVGLIGGPMAEAVRSAALAIYAMASAHARARGIIIADTKFEFGVDDKGQLMLIDEVLTPDSSRFWPADTWRVGTSPPSFDKQFVRDYLETLAWNKRPPGPHLPREIIERTAGKYREALRRLTSS